MALRLYHNIECTQEIAPINPDKVKEIITSGDSITDEVIIYLKSDNPILIYENISLEQQEAAWEDTTEYVLGESVEGSDGNNYMCIQSHTSSSGTKPITGSWVDYWILVNDVEIEYAEDDGGGSPVSYESVLNLGDGMYNSATPIHRKVFVENVTSPIKKTNISHAITSEYTIEWNVVTLFGIAGHTQIIESESPTTDEFPTKIILPLDGNLLYYAHSWRR